MSVAVGEVVGTKVGSLNRNIDELTVVINFIAVLLDFFLTVYRIPK